MFYKGSGGLKSMFFEAISAAQKSEEKHTHMYSITLRTDSTSPSSSVGRTLPTSPRLLCQQLYRRTGSSVYCRQSGERLGESLQLKTMRGVGGAVRSKSDIHSLVNTVCHRGVRQVYFIILDCF